MMCNLQTYCHQIYTIHSEPIHESLSRAWGLKYQLKASGPGRAAFLSLDEDTSEPELCHLRLPFWQDKDSPATWSYGGTYLTRRGNALQRVGCLQLINNARTIYPCTLCVTWTNFASRVTSYHVAWSLAYCLKYETCVMKNIYAIPSVLADFVRRYGARPRRVPPGLSSVLLSGLKPNFITAITLTTYKLYWST